MATDNQHNPDMKDEQLHKAYKEASVEQPSADLDAKILAEAKQVVKTNKRPRWQPRLATAASVAVVILLAIQSKSLYWDADQPEFMSPEESMPTPTARQASPAMAVEQLADERVENDMTSSAEAEVQLAEEATIQQLQAKKSAEQERQEAAVQNRQRLQAAKVKQATSDSRLEAMLTIQKLIEAGELDKAKAQWQQLKSRYPKVPETEPLKSLWAAIEEALQ